MKLNFRRIEMHSFMSFEDEVFDFGGRPEILLVRGRNDDLPNNETNGAGKTNTFAALLYALFGQLYGKIKNENVVNKFAADKDMRLSLTFDVDGSPYRVVRGLNRGKNTYLELYSGNDDITKSTIAETQEFLEKEILMCDVQVFMRTILLTSKQTYNFYEMSKADKKEFVERLFDISAFGDMYKAMHKDLLECEKKILAGQNRLLVLNRQDGEYAQRSQAFAAKRDADLEQCRKDRADAENRLETARSAETKSYADETAKLDAASEKINGARAKLGDKLKELDEKRRKADLAAYKAKSDADGKQAILDKHAVILGKLCDGCRATFKKHYGIETYKDDIEQLLQKARLLTESSAKVQDGRKKIQEKDAELDGKLKKIRDAAVKLAEKRNQATRRIAALESEVSRLEREESRLEKQENPYDGMRRDNAESIKAETARLEKDAETRKYLKYAEGVVSQDTLRKFIISDLIGLLNNKIKTYLTRLGSRYSVVFDSDMNYEFKTEGGAYEFGNFSAGEQMRIMIATSFAFRDFMSIRNGLNANMLVLDEYFDSAVSSACLESMFKILREYVKDCGQTVYCISHRQELAAESFDGVIEVRKRNNISKISRLS